LVHGVRGKVVQCPHAFIGHQGLCQQQGNSDNAQSSHCRIRLKKECGEPPIVSVAVKKPFYALWKSKAYRTRKKLICALT
jgi:hypothetical protein